MSRTSDLPPTPKWIEYDWERVGTRFLFALLFVSLYVVGSHSGTRSGLPIVCNGGLKEALSFLGRFLCALIIVELAHWTAWRLLYWSVLSAQANNPVVPARTRSAVVIDLAQPVQAVRPNPEYQLEITRGKLALAP
jgi:hypothetical protein